MGGGREEGLLFRVPFVPTRVTKEFSTLYKFITICFFFLIVYLSVLQVV